MSFNWLITPLRFLFLGTQRLRALPDVFGEESGYPVPHTSENIWVLEKLLEDLTAVSSKTFAVEPRYAPVDDSVPQAIRDETENMSPWIFGVANADFYLRINFPSYRLDASTARAVMVEATLEAISSGAHLNRYLSDNPQHDAQSDLLWTTEAEIASRALREVVLCRLGYAQTYNAATVYEPVNHDAASLSVFMARDLGFTLFSRYLNLQCRQMVNANNFHAYDLVDLPETILRIAQIARRRVIDAHAHLTLFQKLWNDEKDGGDFYERMSTQLYSPAGRAPSDLPKPVWAELSNRLSLEVLRRLGVFVDRLKLDPAKELELLGTLGMLRPENAPDHTKNDYRRALISYRSRLIAP